MIEIVVTNREIAAEAQHEIFAKRIKEQEMENATYESDADEDIGYDEENDKEKAKTG